jgi:3-hydroxyacyl-[acyl-carrier-protein] dehydratase
VNSEVTSRIPHRPPFLFVDEILTVSEDSITTKFFVRPDLDFFKGHYPENPIMPGVLISEAVFQTGALLTARLMEGAGEVPGGAVPVLSKIEAARFRSIVRPGDELTITARIKERVGQFAFMTGSVKSGARRVMNVDFCVALQIPGGDAGPSS